MSAKSAKSSKKKPKAAAQTVKAAKKPVTAKKKTAPVKKAASPVAAPKKAKPKKTAAVPEVAPAATQAAAPKPAKPAEKPVAASVPAAPAPFEGGSKPSAGKIIDYIKAAVGETHALLLLSGGLVSSTAALLAHKALGAKLKIFLLDNGLMRQDESKETFLLFKKLNIPVNIINARKEFAAALKDKAEPARKREGIRQAFYSDVMRDLVKQSRAKYIINCACADTVGSIGAAALQKDIFPLVNMKPERPFGCYVIEPLAGYRREAVAKLAKELKLPAALYNAPHFPISAMAGRVAGEASTEKVEIARRVTALVDSVMGASTASRTFPVVHQELFPAEIKGKAEEGYQVEIRSWENKPGKTVNPFKLTPKQLDAIAKKVTANVPSVVCITLNVTPQPPLTEETI